MFRVVGGLDEDLGLSEEDSKFQEDEWVCRFFLSEFLIKNYY
jgi:hypothetical protein